MGNRPRYYFAHQLMKSLVFQGKDKLGFMILDDENKFKEMIQEGWKHSNETFNKKYRPYKIELYYKGINEDKLLVLFSSPSPKKMLDTYFCGFVLGGKVPRYFTVEKGMMYTILGEWTTDGHINYGEVSNEIEGIISRIEDIYTDVNPADAMRKIIEEGKPKKALIGGESIENNIIGNDLRN